MNESVSNKGLIFNVLGKFDQSDGQLCSLTLCDTHYKQMSKLQMLANSNQTDGLLCSLMGPLDMCLVQYNKKSQQQKRTSSSMRVNCTVVYQMHSMVKPGPVRY